MPGLHIQPAESFVLPNGLKVILHKDPSEPIVCLQAVVRSGSANERAPEAGFSHFIEHLAFKSSKRYGFNQISSTVSRLGGSLNAYTDFDSTCYYLLLPSEHVHSGLEIISELLSGAKFTAGDVTTEKEIILEEIGQYSDDPETDFLEFIQARYYKRCPLRKPIVGTPKDVRRATHASMKAFYKRRYHPSNCFLVISGAVDPATLKASVDHLFGAWKTPSRATRIPASEWLEPEFGRSGLHWQKANQELFALVLPELSELHPMADALLIAIRYLAIGRASVLHKILVEEKKLCSAVRVSSLCGVMSGASAVTFVPSRKMAIPAIARVIRQEYNKLWHLGVPQAEFELIRKDVVHGWLFGFEARENIANLLAAEELLGDYHSLYEYGDRIDKLSPGDVSASLRKYWHPIRLALAYRGPKQLVLPSDLIPSHPDYLHFPKKDLGTKRPSGEISFPALSNQATKPSPELVRVDERHWQGMLPNGIRFVFKKLAQGPIGSFAVTTPASQLWEGPSERGRNYFLSTMMLYQSGNLSHQAIMDSSRWLGLNIRVSHNVDTTTFKGKCFVDDLAHTLDLTAELLNNPKLDQAYLYTLKAAASDALRRERDYPPSYGYLLWLRAVFGKKNALERSTGSLTDIRALRLSDLNDWYDRYYHAANYSLAICAPLEAQEVWDQVNRSFGRIHFQEHPSRGTTHPIYFKNPRQIVSSGANGQCVIHIGAPATTSKDKVHTTASHVLSQIIGGDINSRFFDLIREQRGLAYQTGMDVVTLDQLGYWTAYAFCGKEDQQLCLDLMKVIIQEVAEHGITAEELELARNYIIGMHRFDSESVSYQASALANLLALGYPLSHLLERNQRIASLDLDTMNLVAARWLRSQDQYIHILQ